MANPTDRERWDGKYANRDYDAQLGPTDFVRAQLPLLKQLLPGRPAAIDIATGTGRNAVYLAKQGFEVTAVDVSPVGLQLARRLAGDQDAEVDFLEADLESTHLEVARYDLVLNSHYLQRTLFPRLVAALKPGGILAFETFCRSTPQHPMKPEFLLAPNELLKAFSGLKILFYEELPTDEWGLARMLALREILP